MAPIATELVLGNEPSRCARTGREQPRQINSLFDHLLSARASSVGAS